MRKLALALVILGLAAGGYALWRWLYPPDAVVIRRVVLEAMQAASWEKQGGRLQALAAANRLASLCTQDVEILLETRGVHSRRLRGRDDLREAALGARTQVAWLRLELDDLEVTILEPGVSAGVLVASTVEASRVREPILQDYKLDMQKVDGDWRIARVEPVKGFGM